jgi:PKD repeat protein
MFTIVSEYQTTAIVFADSNGPYAVDGGSAVTLTAGAPNPNASYEWDLGDGNTATGPSVSHTYGNDGVYVARLTVTVNQPGGDTSQDYALIQVRNVAPVVNVGPDLTVNEGDVVAFTGTFTDVQWLETHKATWDWGDQQPSDPGTVTETHNPPLGRGTVTDSHAWGDSGTYTVTLSVRDQGGAIGRATTTVTVLNVPPSVDAGPHMFAYPCSVLTLSGKFTDPGWFDDHAGFWDFGDGTAPQRAVVREQHHPPAGQGVAIASHTYRECGDYEVTCVVIDDDGGKGKATTVMTVVDIRNRRFEDGSYYGEWGTVANHWQAYLASIPSFTSEQVGPPAGFSSGTDIFAAEEYCVRHGRRSQHIHFAGAARAGLMQTVGANAQWDYQVSVWYSLNEQSGGTSELIEDPDDPSDIVPADQIGGTARLGIDPTGGTDPSSLDIVWSEGNLRPEWAQLSVRATAVGRALTVFLEGEGHGRLGVDVFFDDAALLAVQPFCPPAQPRESCVDFSDLKPEMNLPPAYEKDDFRFVALDGKAQRILLLGPPVSQNGLQVHAEGLEIDTPFVASAVYITLVAPRDVPVIVSAFNAGNSQLGQATGTGTGTVQMLQIHKEDITHVKVTGKGISVIKVCADQ